MRSHGPLSARHMPQFARTVLRAGQVSSAHAHRDMTETFYVVRGRATLTINGTTRVPLAAGTCACVEPGEVHEIVNDDPQGADCEMVYFGIVTGEP